MKTLFFALVGMMAAAGLCFAQAGGNIGYSQAGGSAKAEQNERSKRALSRDEMPPNGTSMFLEASVLMNVRADEYVAVFGVLQEGSTVAECGQKMDAVIKAFSAAITSLGVGRDDLFVDFVAQNRVYGFDVTGDVAREKLAGFELKKNVSIHYKDYALLDRLVLAAAQSQIFDLIKVDYIVKDIPALQNRLMEEAARILKQKAARYQRLLGIRLLPPAQVYAARPSLYFPGDMYDSYAAYESEDVNAGYYRQKYVIQGARKSRTFFFNALNAGGFDTVINPVVIEPVVQATLYLKVKYALEQPAGRAQGQSGKGRPGPKAK
jgi:uncharacterized protein YggE